MNLLDQIQQREEYLRAELKRLRLQQEALEEAIDRAGDELEACRAYLAARSGKP